MVASNCWWWHCRIDEQIMLRSNYGQILWDKSSSLASKRNYALSFWNLRFMKSTLASLPYSNGLGMSLLPSRVNNLVIGNGRMWFLYSKRRLLTQHIREFLQVWPGPFPIFGWGLETGENSKLNHAPWKPSLYQPSPQQQEFILLASLKSVPFLWPLMSLVDPLGSILVNLGQVTTQTVTQVLEKAPGALFDPTTQLVLHNVTWEEICGSEWSEELLLY